MKPNNTTATAAGLPAAVALDMATPRYIGDWYGPDCYYHAARPFPRRTIRAAYLAARRDALRDFELQLDPDPFATVIVTDSVTGEIVFDSDIAPSGRPYRHPPPPPPEPEIHIPRPYHRKNETRPATGKSKTRPANKAKKQLPHSKKHKNEARHK